MADPARVLMVTNDFPPQLGGIQRWADNILRRLPNALVYAGSHPDAAAFDRAAPYHVLRGPRRFMLPTPEVERDLDQVIRAEQPDVLLFAAPWPLPLLGPRFDLPFAVCTHGAEAVVPARLRGGRAALRRFLRRANLLFAVSDHTARWVRRTVGDDGPPIRLLRNSVDLDAFHPTVDGAAIRDRHGLGDEPVIACVGRLVPRKGQDMLIKAMPAVRALHPEARLLIVGDGPSRGDLERLAAGLPDNTVTFTGAVPEQELAAHHAAADVFAHPNRSRRLGLEEEGFGLVFLEAAACARPVIAGDSGGSPEALQPGVTGLLVDGHDVASITAALDELLSDPERARAMGKAGRAFVEDTYDPDRIVSHLQEDLEALVAGRPPASEH
ncbi:MAG: glycosyltransferase family 4 protein [Nitriliruptorales bacterium]|nr:glycosyltransferase family 4 protein [Nitriliruptorales bacterium]